MCHSPNDWRLFYFIKLWFKTVQWPAACSSLTCSTGGQHTMKSLVKTLNSSSSKLFNCFSCLLWALKSTGCFSHGAFRAHVLRWDGILCLSSVTSHFLLCFVWMSSQQTAGMLPGTCQWIYFEEEQWICCSGSWRPTWSSFSPANMLMETVTDRSLRSSSLLFLLVWTRRRTWPVF